MLCHVNIFLLSNMSVVLFVSWVYDVRDETYVDGKHGHATVRVSNDQMNEMGCLPFKEFRFGKSGCEIEVEVMKLEKFDSGSVELDCSENTKLEDTINDYVHMIHPHHS